MPVYNYICPRCGAEEDDICLYRHKKYPTCTCGRRMIDDFKPRTTKTSGDKERVSFALGVHVSQIASGEAEKIHPGAKYDGDGNMIIKNYTEKKQRMKERGFVDRDEGKGWY